MGKDVRRVCVIGCAGFIGSHLLDRLLADGGWQIAGIDLDDRKIRHLLDDERLDFIKGDYTALPDLSEQIGSADLVISLSALCNPALYNTEPVRVIEANYTHPVRIIDTCTRLKKRLVYFSTSEVYGKTAAALTGRPEDAGILDEETSPLIYGGISRQRWTYACAKQMAERYLYARRYEDGLDYTVVRPFNFIGPRMDFIPSLDGDGIPRVLACFMDALMHGKPLQLVDGGEAQRVFTDVEDAVDALLRIMDRPEQCTGKTFNIGNPANEASVVELAELMIRLYKEETGEDPGATCGAVRVSAREFYGKGYDDCDRRRPDIARARELLDWEPRYGLEETLRRSIHGFVSAYGSVSGRV